MEISAVALFGARSMKPVRYFDDPEIGPARETSHPRFVDLARDEFYYDCTDDFSPFGSDDGSDALSALEEWFQEGGKEKHVSKFLKQLLRNWGFGIPKNMIVADSEAKERWLSADEMHGTYLQAECRARVAAAFGQLKITGNVDSEILHEGLSALRCQLWLNNRSRELHPNWKHADAEHENLVKMSTVLGLVMEKGGA